MAFYYVFNMAYPIKYDHQHICQRAVELHILTRSLSLFEVLTRNQATTEKH